MIVQNPARASSGGSASRIRLKADEKISWFGNIPFLLVHAGCLLVFWAGFSWTALGIGLLSFFSRMFGITGGFHRYFSHRTYKTSRVFQFLLAFWGTTAAQMGPLWWAAHHRTHHRFSDTENDIHSPGVKGFFYSHMGWILCRKNHVTHWKNIRDFAQFPELRFLDRYHYLAPATLILLLASAGFLIEAFLPFLETTAFQILVWGFFLSTVLLYQCTFSINTFAHMIGKRRFETHDDSRNSFWLALATLGEGWHNNHHYYPGSERQGFYWWEIDITHYILRVLSWFGLVWDLRTPPPEIYGAAQAGRGVKQENRILPALVPARSNGGPAPAA
ncbi:MAG: acyl-CoA desaturase [bacterium]